MKYTYINNEKSYFADGQWHHTTVFVCQAENITQADELFEKETGDKPIKAPRISVIICK